MLNKKNVLWISGIITIIFLVSNIVGTYNICGKYSIGNCPSIIHNILILFLIFISIFILSLITYKMRDLVFQSWLKFAYVWVPLTIVLTFMAPEYDSSLLPITKGVVSFYMSLLFLIISTIIITLKYRSSKK